LNLFLENYDDNKIIPKFVISTKLTKGYINKILDLIFEIIKNTKFDNYNRLKEIIEREKSKIEDQIKNNGYKVALTRCLSYFNNSGYFNELTENIEYYYFIKNLYDNFDNNKEKIVKNLYKLAELLFNKNNMIINITCENNDFLAIKNNIEKFINLFQDNKILYYNWDFKLKNKKEAILSSSKVQYVIQGYNIKKLGYGWDGKLRVLNKVLSSDYLQNKIRIIGGAYGGFSIISPYGTLLLISFRDPNLYETLSNFTLIPDYLNNFNPTQDEMKRYIIVTIAQLDKPLTPQQKGYLALKNSLEKISYKNILEERLQILNTMKEDIQKMSEIIKNVIKLNNYCVFGNENKINENKQLFENIILPIK